MTATTTDINELLNDPFIAQVQDRLKARVLDAGAVLGGDGFSDLVAEVMQEVLAENTATFAALLESPERRDVYRWIGRALYREARGE